MAFRICSMVTKFQKHILFRCGSSWVGALKLQGCFFDGRQTLYRRFCSTSMDEINEKMIQQDDVENSSKIKNNIEDQKLIKVAVIGEPNSGKSTFVNSLVGEKIFAVTEKPHTTRQGAQAAFTIGSSQIVLLDTPGVVTKSEGRRLKMSRDHLAAPENALQQADLICVLSDSSNKRTRDRLHTQVLDVLKKHEHVPSLLILNKIDKLKHKTDLLGLTAVLTEHRAQDEWGYVETGGWGNFEHTFMISAQDGDGMNDVKDYFALKAKPGEWMFDHDSTCELTVEQRVAEVFREKIWILYEHEIPFQVKQVSVILELREPGILRIHQKLFCRKKSQRRCVLEKINKLQEEVFKELTGIFTCEVDLTIEVGVAPKLAYNSPLPVY